MKRLVDPLPGIPARWPGDCPRCPVEIQVGDRIVFSRGRPIHAACVSGGDDE